MIRTKSKIIKDMEFPFQLIHAYGMDSARLDDPLIHSHDCLEINYVVGGKGYYLFGEEKYELHPGDIYIINNQEYHMAYNVEDLHLIVLVFNAELVWNGSPVDYMYLKAFFERKKGDKPYLEGSLPVAKSIAAHILEMDRQWQEKEPGYRILIKADLLKVLGLIYSYYEKLKYFDGSGAHSWGKYHSIMTAVDYISAHYQERLTLKEMADMVHMSENYFSAVFREIMQMTFSRYVLDKRLQQACLLLKTTTESIADIGYASGFETVSYFNKVFKKEQGMSPGAYRAAHKMKSENSKN